MKLKQIILCIVLLFSVAAFAANTATKQLTLVVTPAPLQIITTTVTAAQVGVPYTLTLLASGGVTPYTWSLVSGSTLPNGLTLSPSGVISGTPTASGSFTFTAEVVDSAVN